MTTPVPIMLNYTTLGLTSIVICLLLMREVFGRPRHVPFYIAFFALRFFIDVLAFYDEYFFPLASGTYVDAAAPSFRLARILFTVAEACASFAVIARTFDGDPVEVVACGVATNSASSVMTASAALAGNLVTGASVDSGYFVPLGLGTVVAVAVSFSEYLALRRPLILLTEFTRRLVERNRIRCVIAIAVFTLAFTLASFGTILYLPFSYAFVAISFTVLLMMAPIATSILLSFRELHARERMMWEYTALIGTYRQQICDEVEQIDQALAVFEGHAQSLVRLGEVARAVDAKRRIDRLQQSYEHVCMGTYCSDPALDAVLLWHANRLERLGVRCNFTVAGVSGFTAHQSILAHSLLRLVLDLAKRAQRNDDEVVLRIRGTADEVLYHLEIPRPWGRLGAARFLRKILGERQVLVNEWVEGDRLVVTAMAGLASASVGEAA